MMAAPQYVSQAEFDSFQGKMMGEISSLKSAFTEDARSRARRDGLLTTQLEELSRRIGNRRESDNDITGRFVVAEQNIIKKAQHKALPREFSINVTGTALAIMVWKLIELYLSAKGH